MRTGIGIGGAASGQRRDWERVVEFALEAERLGVDFAWSAEAWGMGMTRVGVSSGWGARCLSALVGHVDGNVGNSGNPADALLDQPGDLAPLGIVRGQIEGDGHLFAVHDATRHRLGLQQVFSGIVERDLREGFFELGFQIGHRRRSYFGFGSGPRRAAPPNWPFLRRGQFRRPQEPGTFENDKLDSRTPQRLFPDPFPITGAAFR